jgi:hypothetical protein
MEQPENFDLRPVGKIFMAEYAKFIAGKNEKLGSAGQLEAVRKLGPEMGSILYSSISQRDRKI